MSAVPTALSETRSESDRPSAARRRQLVLAFGAVAALAACGKKGELQLPPAATSPEAADQQPDGEG